MPGHVLASIPMAYEPNRRTAWPSGRQPLVRGGGKGAGAGAGRARPGKSCHYKLRASPAKATMELPFAQNYPAATSELLLSPHRLAAVY